MIAKPIAALLLTCAFAGAVLGVRHSRSSGMQAASVQEGRIKGSPKARLSVVEYFDYQCGACRTAYQLFEQYERVFPGSIRVEMRYFPLPGHRHGMKAAIYADCAAAQQKFWPFHDRLMNEQARWSPLADPSQLFRDFAREAGVDAASFDRCTADPETEMRILKEKEGGMQLGVKLTPTCLFNGHLVVGSNAIAENLKKEFGELQKTDG